MYFQNSSEREDQKINTLISLFEWRKRSQVHLNFKMTMIVLSTLNQEGNMCSSYQREGMGRREDRQGREKQGKERIWRHRKAVRYKIISPNLWTPKSPGNQQKEIWGTWNNWTLHPCEAIPLSTLLEKPDREEHLSWHLDYRINFFHLIIPGYTLRLTHHILTMTQHAPKSETVHERTSLGQKTRKPQKYSGPPHC